MPSHETLRLLLVFAGVSQLLLVAASPAIPRILRWREDTAKLRPLTREVFWTWGAYVWLTHLAFGLLSGFEPDLLLDGSPLAGLVAGFIATWWGARFVLQFTTMDRKSAPPGLHVRLAEVGLVALFSSNAAIYGAVTAKNFLGR
jgi:hypothetical protein